MKLTKIIYQNNKEVNNFIIDGEKANFELINLLLQKIDKKYKIDISKDKNGKEITANLYFNHYNFDGKILAKYKYYYKFENVNNQIEL